jgi:hypothetical protein
MSISMALVTLIKAGIHMTVFNVVMPDDDWSHW